MEATATAFTPWASLAGGALIGISAVLLMAVKGRIAGISGIASRILPPYGGDSGLPGRLAFLAGLVLAPLAYMAATGRPVVQTVSPQLLPMAMAGLLVGFGAVWGSGCTSGHGVCGLARLSPRSLAATATFMCAGIATVFLVRHLAGG